MEPGFGRPLGRRSRRGRGDHQAGEQAGRRRWRSARLRRYPSTARGPLRYAAGRVDPVVELVRDPLIDEILDARRAVARGQDAAFEGLPQRRAPDPTTPLARSRSPPPAEDAGRRSPLPRRSTTCTRSHGLDDPAAVVSRRRGVTCARPGARGGTVRSRSTIAFHDRARVGDRGEHARLAEPFRRADWNDFTMGLGAGRRTAGAAQRGRRRAPRSRTSCRGGRVTRLCASGGRRAIPCVRRLCFEARRGIAAHRSRVRFSGASRPGRDSRSPFRSAPRR